MSESNMIITLITVLPMLLSVVVSQTFKVEEGLNQRQFIGSVAQSPELQESIQNLNLNLSLLRYTIFSTGKAPSEYFIIDESTGAVYTNGALDRELLCLPEEVPCTVQLDISAHNSLGFVQILNVQVIVDDINDNFPVFPDSPVIIQISEAEPLNSTITFRGATDQDGVGINSQISYGLITTGSPFDLRVISYPDRTQDVGLVIARKLDREQVASYQLEIVAKDGGEPQRTGTVIVEVSITDINDNYPEFTKGVYPVTISEDLPVNTPILQVIATDLDSDKNGQVTYKFSTSTTAFVINATSGKVAVGENVDYEQKQVYKLLVEASDSGAVPKTKKTLVVVNVSDVNDNAPEMSYNFIPSGNEAVIPEQSALGTFVAYMSVSDKDHGENAMVTCNVEGTRYTLETQKLNEYKVTLQTELDYELEREDFVRVVCVDSGNPRLSTTSGFKVLVQDINDNTPILPKSEYSITITEGLQIGTILFNISAIDKDSGDNGRITYYIDGKEADMFAVSEMGEIWVNLTPDRETTSTVSVTLIAKDNGSPAKSATAAITVTITDINDEIPLFAQNEYRFNVTENIEEVTVLGSVLAEDLDLGLGGEVFYRLTSNYDSQFFAISGDSGVISVSQPLDREDRAIRELVVVAQDKGEPSLSSSVTVFVKVLDINDNTPYISYPSTKNYTVSVPSTLPINSEVITILALDKDDGDNSRLSFVLLEDEKSPTHFRINATSGKVTLVKDIEMITSKTFRISLAVRDHGTPQRETVSNFSVHVSVLNETAVIAQSEPGHYNLVIVISVIAMTAVLSAVILATICVIRRRDKKPVERSNVRPDLYDQPAHKKTEHKTSKIGEIVRGEKIYEAQTIPVHKVHPVPNYEAPLKSSSPKDVTPYSKKKESSVEERHLQYIRDFFPSDNLDLSSQSEQSRHNNNNLQSQDHQKTSSTLKQSELEAPRRSSQRHVNKKPRQPNRVQWALESSAADYSAQVLAHPDGYCPKPDDSTSDLSGDTATSDSGRGGSDDDVHRGYCLQIEHEGVHGHYV